MAEETIYRLRCDRCGATVSGPDEKAVKSGMNAHKRTPHAKTEEVVEEEVEEEEEAVEDSDGLRA